MAGRERDLSMILPAHDPVTGEVDRAAYGDVRIPARLTHEFQPRVFAGNYWSERCPAGRHLWDAIEAVDQEVEYDDGRCEQRFRLVLTCVRCGDVHQVEGVADNRRGRSDHVGRLDPEPIRAGALRAQQVQAGRIGERDCSIWSVHDLAGTRVGTIQWACGKRGRHYFTGRLRASGQSVEGPSPRAVLRKLAADRPPEQAPADPWAGGERR